MVLNDDCESVGFATKFGNLKCLNRTFEETVAVSFKEN